MLGVIVQVLLKIEEHEAPLTKLPLEVLVKTTLLFVHTFELGLTLKEATGFSVDWT